MGIVEIALWLKEDDSYNTLLQSSPMEFQILFCSKRVAERSRKQLILIQFASLTQLVGPLESTPSPHYEWKGKSKDYH